MTAIQNFIDEKVRLPSPPAIAIKILDAVRRDEDSFTQLADIIRSDPSLAARTLKVANSSLYRCQGCIDSLAQATALIGTQALKNIALSFVIIESFQDAPQGSFDLNLFWRRAVSAAVAAEMLAARINLQDKDIFVTSLLQDIGVLVMFLSDTVTYTEVIDTKRINGKCTAEAEKDRFGFNHSEVGYHLLRTWNIPETISRPIRIHHDQDPEKTYLDTVRVLVLADKIASIYHGTQRNRKFIEVNRHLMETYGLNREEISDLINSIGENVLEVLDNFSIPPGAMKPFSQIMQEANEELGRLNYSYEEMVLELTQAKQNAEQLAIELKQANDKLRELALRDGLTNLYNHRYFHEVFELQIQNSLRYNHPLSLMIIDIDQFKRVNDTYGHPFGDQVLKEISQVMVRLVRRSDIVARYGGEEFAIILPETGTVSARVLAQRLRRGIEQHTLHHHGKTISVTVSIGLVGSDMKDVELAVESLISRGDRALYKAKWSGRNRVES